MTRNEKLLAIAKKALYRIARNQAVDPDAEAQRALCRMARMKGRKA